VLLHIRTADGESIYGIDSFLNGAVCFAVKEPIGPSRLMQHILGDFFVFDEDHYRAVGRHTHRSIRLGDPLRIRVKATSLEQKLLDYELVEPGISETADGRYQLMTSSPEKTPSNRMAPVPLSTTKNKNG